MEPTPQARPRLSRVPEVIALTAILLLCGLGALGLVVVGVASAESCSSEIGSLERNSALYRPCELIGFVQAIALVAVVALPSVALVKHPRVRLLMAVVGVGVVLAIAFSGLTSSALP